MDDQIAEIQQKLAAGELVPSEPQLDLTITVAPNFPRIRNGDIEIISGVPFLVSEVSTHLPFQVAKVRRLVEGRHQSDPPG